MIDGRYEVEAYDPLTGGDYLYRVVRIHSDGLREILVSNLKMNEAAVMRRDCEENF